MWRRKKQLAIDFAKIISQIASNNLKGLIKDVVLPSFQSLITVIKSAGYIGSAIVIALDVYNAIVTAKKIVIKTQGIPRCGKKTSTIKRH